MSTKTFRGQILVGDELLIFEGEEGAKAWPKAVKDAGIPQPKHVPIPYAPVRAGFKASPMSATERALLGARINGRGHRMDNAADSLEGVVVAYNQPCTGQIVSLGPDRGTVWVLGDDRRFYLMMQPKGV